MRALPARRLPRDPGQRFAVLFRERARWEWQDLEPYLADIRVGARLHAAAGQPQGLLPASDLTKGGKSFLTC